MNIKDIEDTIECRKKILEYIKYLKQGKEQLEEEFKEKIIVELFTDKSLDTFQAKKSMLMQTLSRKKALLELNNNPNAKQKEMEKMKVIISDYDMLAIELCLGKEVENNYRRIDAIIENPIFAKAIAIGKLNILKYEL